MSRRKVQTTSQNILGLPMPVIYIGGSAYSLPLTDRGNRIESFDKEVKTWTDLDQRLHERIKGYRLRAEYSWDWLEPQEMNDLLDMYNEAENTADLKIKFQNFPRRYSVKISEFEHELASGLGFKDSAAMSFIGVNLLDAFPNPDLYFSMVPLLGRGTIVRTLNEQGL